MKPIRERPLVAIIDDEACIRRTVSRFLLAAGFDADTFASGEQFIARFDIARLAGAPPFEPDCVILDLQLAGLDEFEVQRYLTRYHPHIPVILVSAADDSRTREQALVPSAAACLIKPVDAERLVITLYRVLKNRSSGTS